MPAEDLQEQLIKYLTDVHSTEQNAVVMMRTGAENIDNAQLAELFRDHLNETEEHERLVRRRLEAHDAEPSTLKDLAQKGGAMASGAVAKMAPDTDGKMAIQAYAFEHLEIASYRMLRAVAQRAGDHETVEVADHILEQEQTAARKLDGLLEQVAEHDLKLQGMVV